MAKFPSFKGGGSRPTAGKPGGNSRPPRPVSFAAFRLRRGGIKDRERAQDFFKNYLNPSHESGKCLRAGAEGGRRRKKTLDWGGGLTLSCRGILNPSHGPVPPPAGKGCPSMFRRDHLEDLYCKVV